MAFTANTVLKGKPATIEVNDAGAISCASGGSKWEFSKDLQPVRFTRDDGDTMVFTQMKNGRGLASVSFGGQQLPATPASVENTPTLASFVPVLQAVSDVSGTPGFPEEVKAKLADGLTALGQGTNAHGIF